MIMLLYIQLFERIKKKQETDLVLIFHSSAKEINKINYEKDPHPGTVHYNKKIDSIIVTKISTYTRL